MASWPQAELVMEMGEGRYEMNDLDGKEKGE